MFVSRPRLVFGAAVVGLLAGAAASSAQPSFDCAKAESSAEKLVCEDEALAALDRQLAGIYAEVLPTAERDGWGSTLVAEQRGWVKGRDECWKADDPRACVQDEYELRISELQAGFARVPSRGPFFWACAGNPANEVVVTFFDSLRPSARMERGDRTATLYRAPAASGARYEGANASFWEHQGEATIEWFGESMTCTPKSR